MDSELVIILISSKHFSLCLFIQCFAQTIIETQALFNFDQISAHRRQDKTPPLYLLKAIAIMSVQTQGMKLSDRSENET